MSKARDLANFVSTGNPLADGTLNVADISDLTASAAEINVLDGVTASTAELNILDGVTATSSELNILDGVTVSTAELNILDGVTSDATELNLLDGSSAGTVANSKAVIYDGSGGIVATQIDITGTGDLRLQDTTGGEYVALQAPGTVSASYTLTLPAADGTNGQVLQTNGSGALSFADVGGGGSLIYLATINPSNAASVYFSNTYITSTYDEYEIHGNASVSNYWQLQAQIDTGVSPTTVTSGYQFSAFHFRSSSPTYLGSSGSSWSFNTASNTLYGLCTFVVRLRDIGSDGKSFQSTIVGGGGGSAWFNNFGCGYNPNSSVLSGITLYGSTGNITGSFRLYGVKKT